MPPERKGGRREGRKGHCGAKRKREEGLHVSTLSTESTPPAPPRSVSLRLVAVPRAVRPGQLPEPEPPSSSSPSLGLSVVAVGRQCLNVLVFLPELLFGASEQATVETSRPVRRRTHRRTDATAKVRHTKKRKRRPDDAGDATDASSADSLMFHTTVMDYESIELIGVRTVRCVRTCFPPRARASCLVCSTARRPCPPAPVPHVDFFLLADVWEKEKEKKKKKKKKKKGEK